MKAAMKIYVVKGSILPGEESEAEKDQTKESRASKEDLSALLTTGEKGETKETP